VDLIVDPLLDAATAQVAVDKATLTKYDGVVLVLGVNDALRITPAAEWRRHLEALLAILAHRSVHATPILVTGIEPISSLEILDPLTGAVADSHARRLNTATGALCDSTPQATFVPLLGEANDRDRCGSPAQYDHWAQTIADTLSVTLAKQRPHPEDRFVLTPSLEAQRQNAIDSLDLEAVRNAPTFRNLVESARRAFGTEVALLSVLDDDRQWHLATAGLAPADIPPTSSFCGTTIQTDNGLIIPDTLDDPRFRDSPVVTAGPKVRFYAGFPIEAPGGERLGALCVIDPQPRRRQSDLADIALLRELALQVQRELWRQLSVPVTLARLSGQRPRVTRGPDAAVLAPDVNDLQSVSSSEPMRRRPCIKATRCLRTFLTNMQPDLPLLAVGLATVDVVLIAVLVTIGSRRKRKRIEQRNTSVSSAARTHPMEGLWE
jgi:hypothetical protein